MMILQLSASVDKIRHILHFNYIFIYVLTGLRETLRSASIRDFFTGGKLSEIETLNINYK